MMMMMTIIPLKFKTRKGPKRRLPLAILLLGHSYRVFSRDVMAAICMLVFLNDGTEARLVYPTNPPRIELYYHANVFFCFGGKIRLLIT